MVSLMVAAAADPMAQFQIKRIVPLELFGHDISFTNSSLFMVLALVLISVFMIAAMGGRALVPGRVQSIAESLYEFVEGLVRENLGEEGKKFFPWVFTIFVFILMLNMLGMIPGSFTVTSHIIITFARRHGLDRRDRRRLRSSRRGVLETLRARRRADLADAVDRAD